LNLPTLVRGILGRQPTSEGGHYNNTGKWPQGCAGSALALLGLGFDLKLCGPGAQLAAPLHRRAVTNLFRRLCGRRFVAVG
jgi:hypothetical protein